MTSNAFTPNNPESKMKVWMDTVLKRLRNLETAQRLTSSSIRDGALHVLNNAGVQVAQIGKGTWLNDVGTVITNTVLSLNKEDSGELIWLMDAEHGQVSPISVFNWTEDTFVSTASGSFVTTWRSQICLTGLVIRCNVYVSADAGTTGEIRLNIGGLFTQVHTIPASTFQSYSFDWDLSTLSLPLMTPQVVSMQARRTGGAGNINVYSPPGVSVLAQPLFPDAVVDGII